jgi:hypothetical protein
LVAITSTAFSFQYATFAAGFAGGNKMKDWDKAAASDEDGSAGEQLGGSDEED